MAEGPSMLWRNGDAYERYMGRWSRCVAPRFLEWLSAPAGLDWIDVGCGTGALSTAILAACAPVRVCGVEPSPAFVESARVQMGDSRWSSRQASAEALPYADHEFDMAVSGLVLNFVTDRDRALGEMIRVVRPGGTVGAYVWDYAGHMQIARYFFDAAIELDPAAQTADEKGILFCRPTPLAEMFAAAGLAQVEVRALDFTAAFGSFEDYWAPFLGGTGTAPKYCVSLAPAEQTRLRELLRERLPVGPDGEILLAMRAWAVKGRVEK